MRIKHVTLALMSSLVLTACASAPGPSETAPAATATAPAPTSTTTAPATASASAVTMVPATQVRQGENAFLASCTACHSSSEFSARAFQRRWTNRVASDLYDIMSATMPEDAPASLPPAQYVDITAYILSLNGFETGSGDAWTAETLQRVNFGDLGSR